MVSGFPANTLDRAGRADDHRDEGALGGASWAVNAPDDGPYGLKVRSLFGRYRQKTPAAEPRLVDVALWAATELAQDVSHPTWKVYRNALISVAGEDREVIELILSGITGAARSIDRRQGYWSTKDRQLLERWAQRHGCPAPMAAAALAWLDATIVTGLQPMEWFDAFLRHDPGGRSVLVVRMANKAGRTNSVPRLREVPVDNADLAIVEAQLNHVAPYRRRGRTERARCYRSVQNVISRAGREVFGGRVLRPTMYCARQEFAHALRDRGCSPDEMARLLGLAPDSVRRIYFAKGDRTRRNRNERRRG